MLQKLKQTRGLEEKLSLIAATLMFQIKVFFIIRTYSSNASSRRRRRRPLRVVGRLLPGDVQLERLPSCRPLLRPPGTAQRDSNPGHQMN